MKNHITKTIFIWMNIVRAQNKSIYVLPLPFPQFDTSFCSNFDSYYSKEFNLLHIVVHLTYCVTLLKGVTNWVSSTSYLGFYLTRTQCPFIVKSRWSESMLLLNPKMMKNDAHYFICLYSYTYVRTDSCTVTDHTLSFRTRQKWGFTFTQFYKPHRNDYKTLFTKGSQTKD